MRHVTFILLMMLHSLATVQAEESDVPTMAPDELENYQFETSPTESHIEVTELSYGQQFAMSSKRGEIEDLLKNNLGVSKLTTSVDDLQVLQQLVDRELIAKGDIGTWQALGIVLGDILAKEFDLHWVALEDDVGKSGALQWGETMNFVFPVTLLSRRVQFGQAIDIPQIYRKIAEEVEAFKSYENSRESLKMPGIERLSRGNEHDLGAQLPD